MYIQFGKKNKRKILFIHGFLGSNREFLKSFPVNDFKKKFHLIFLNLEITEDCNKFEDYINHLGVNLSNNFGKIDLVIGYSMGGRVAVNLKNQYPNCIKKLILISSALNPPLFIKKRQKRANSDKKLLSNIHTKKQLTSFMKRWYQQNLFHNLYQEKSTEFKIKNFNLTDIKRQRKLIKVLSVGNQPLISTKKFKSSIIYIYGKHDRKYKIIATKNNLKKIEFTNSGHAPHIQEKSLFRIEIKKIINDILNTAD